MGGTNSIDDTSSFSCTETLISGVPSGSLPEGEPLLAPELVTTPDDSGIREGAVAGCRLTEGVDSGVITGTVADFRLTE